MSLRSKNKPNNKKELRKEERKKGRKEERKKRRKEEKKKEMSKDWECIQMFGTAFHYCLRNRTQLTRRLAIFLIKFLG